MRRLIACLTIEAQIFPSSPRSFTSASIVSTTKSSASAVLFIFCDTFFQNFKPIFSNFFLSFLSSFFSFYKRGSKDFFFFLHNSISKQHSIDLGLSSGIHNQKSLFFNYNRFKSFKLFRLSKLASNHFYSTNSKVLPSIFFFLWL